MARWSINPTPWTTMAEITVRTAELIARYLDETTPEAFHALMADPYFCQRYSQRAHRRFEVMTLGSPATSKCWSTIDDFVVTRIASPGP